MPTIITPGVPTNVPTPWFFAGPVTCPQCLCVFQLVPDDFDEFRGGTPGAGPSSHWRIVSTDRTPGYRQTIAGVCPGCATTVQIEGRMGGD